MDWIKSRHDFNFPLCRGWLKGGAWGRCQGCVVEGAMRITVYRNGFELEKLCLPSRQSSQASASRRGRIVGWSDKSRRRLRKYLLEFGGVGDCYGITLTLPRLVSMDEWRRIVNRWSVYTSRLGVCAVYRIELQERGAPHIHAVCWLRDTCLLADCVEIWLNALRPSAVEDDRYGVVGLDCVDGAMLHSWHVERVADGDFAVFRYMCDHASKRKQAQLGYEGRQWGVVNRKSFVSRYLCAFDLTDSQYDSVLRYIRRLSHCRVSRGNGGRTTWFTSPVTLARIIDFVRQK